MLKNLLITSALVFSALPALADGIELPKKVQTTPGGGFVVRSTVSTTNDVSRLEYGIFEVNNGSVGEEITQGVVKRPEFMKTTAGEKRNILFTFPAESVKSSQLAVCMFSPPPKPEANRSQLVASFRYCKLFAVEKK